MRRARPPAVLVIGILNLVFGCLGACCYFCSAGGNAFMLMGWMIPGATDIQMQFPGQDTNTHALNVAIYSSELVLSLVLITAGIGLLRMRAWGRWLSFGYSIVEILAEVVRIVLQFSYISRVKMEMLEGQLQGAMPGMPNPKALVLMDSIGSSAPAVFGILFAIAVLIVLNLRSVRMAFAKPAFTSSPRDAGAGEPPSV
jgi:hypothetical protein